MMRWIMLAHILLIMALIPLFLIIIVILTKQLVHSQLINGEFAGDIVSGMVSFNHTSDTNNNVEIRSRIVGFGTTGMGSGTLRFKSTGQIDGSERSVIISRI